MGIYSNFILLHRPISETDISKAQHMKQKNYAPG